LNTSRPYSSRSVAFGEAGADFADLDAILLTHLHTDHAADLPAFIKGSFFTARDRDLLLAGPSGNDRMPATTSFAQALFGADGAFRYLGSYLDGEEAYRLVPRNMPAAGAGKMRGEGWHASSLPVRHGPIPALAWRLTVGGCVIVYAGDMAAAPDGFITFAEDADLLLLHSAIPEDAGPVARCLHMRPGELAELARQTTPRRLLLSHFMRRSEQTARQSFAGLPMPVILAEDGMMISVE